MSDGTDSNLLRAASVKPHGSLRSAGSHAHTLGRTPGFENHGSGLRLCHGAGKHSLEGGARNQPNLPPFRRRSTWRPCRIPDSSVPLQCPDPSPMTPALRFVPRFQLVGGRVHAAEPFSFTHHGLILPSDDSPILRKSRSPAVNYRVGLFVRVPEGSGLRLSS
jgi:hypothetical protein